MMDKGFIVFQTLICASYRFFNFDRTHIPYISSLS